jgi:hypothetical protein
MNNPDSTMTATIAAPATKKSNDHKTLCITEPFHLAAE